MAKGAKEQPSFEGAVERLEEIIEQMESSDLPLDQIIERYEEGMKLLTVCEDKLKVAEAKIELLTRDKSGKVTSSDLSLTEQEHAASVEEAINADKKKASGEVSLF
ncbi:MAG: exodeoxyribonuclease VII small subunit [Blastochloris sp.]|nr:exodeoxyribonuclease VII small subunit [Blastochloris sp.]